MEILPKNTKDIAKDTTNNVHFKDSTCISAKQQPFAYMKAQGLHSPALCPGGFRRLGEGLMYNRVW